MHQGYTTVPYFGNVMASLLAALVFGWLLESEPGASTNPELRRSELPSCNAGHLYNDCLKKLIGWCDASLKCKQGAYRAVPSLLILLTASRATSILIRDKDGWFCDHIASHLFLTIILEAGKHHWRWTAENWQNQWHDWCKRVNMPSHLIISNSNLTVSTQTTFTRAKPLSHQADKRNDRALL